jgi:hypothetical protein
MDVDIQDVNQVNPYADSNGMPLKGMLIQYDEFEEARALLKFSLLSPEEKKQQLAANKHMAKKMS